jgi:hypothetical protein
VVGEFDRLWLKIPPEEELEFRGAVVWTGAGAAWELRPKRGMMIDGLIEDGCDCFGPKFLARWLDD